VVLYVCMYMYIYIYIYIYTQKKGVPMEDPFDTFSKVGGSKEPNWFSSRHEKAFICFSRRCIASKVHSFWYTKKRIPASNRS